MDRGKSNQFCKNGEGVIQDLQHWLLELSPNVFQHENRIIRIIFPSIRIEILNPIKGQSPDLVNQIVVNRPEQIEILTVQSGLNFQQCYENRKVDFLDGIEVNIVSLHDLKSAKRTGNRPKDLEDLRNLETGQGELIEKPKHAG